MHRKYFSKNQGVLSRKFIASGLSAVFSAGMFSSYAGAMEAEFFKDDNLVFNAEPFDKAVQALNILDEIKRCIWDNSLYMKSDIGLATNFEFQILELLDEYNGGSENGNDVLR